MGYYSGSLIIHNETAKNNTNEQGLIATLKFSANFNKNKLYLNNTILNQILDSNVVQKFIIKECSDYMKKNDIESNIKKLFTLEQSVTIDIKIIGKYFYIKFYCGRNHTIEDCISELTRKLRKEKNKINLLKGK